MNIFKAQNILLVFFLLSIIISPIYAQTPNFEWAVQSGGNSSDAVKDMVMDLEGSIYIVGNFRDTITFGSNVLTSSGSDDIFLAKFDSMGNVIWATKAGGGDIDNGISAAIDNENNIIIAGVFSLRAVFGSFIIDSDGGYDVFVAKYSPSGDVLWAVRGGGEGYDFCYSVAADNLNDIVITGNFSSFAQFGPYTVFGNSQADIFAAKYNAQGDAQWALSTNGSPGYYNTSYAVTTDLNNDIYIAGGFEDAIYFPDSSSFTGRGSNDIFLAKFSSIGSFLWARQGGGETYDIAEDIKTDHLGNVYLTGTFGGTALFESISLTAIGYSDIFAAKYNSIGIPEWVNQKGWFEVNAEGTAIDVDDFGNTAAAGRLIDGSEDAILYLGKFNEESSTEWDILIRNNSFSTSAGLDFNPSGDLFIANNFVDSIRLGNYLLNNNGNDDIFTAKIPVPKILLASTEINFGNIEVGKDSTQDISIINNSRAILHLENIIIAGLNTSDFFILSSPADSLLPFESYSLQISFNPSQEGIRTAYVLIYSDALTSPDTVQLTGNGIVPQLSIFIDTLDFGIVDVNTTLEGAIEIVNNSSAPIIISSAAIEGLNSSEFSIVNPSFPDTLIFQETKTVNINFSPSSEGIKNAFVVFNSNSLTSPDSVNLYGIGRIVPLSFSEDTLDFGSIDVNNFSERILRIINPGLANIHISDISISGLNSNEFSLINTIVPDSISPQSFKNITVRFAPLSSGQKTAEIIILSNVLSSPDSIMLLGNAISLINVKLSQPANLGEPTGLEITPPLGFEFSFIQFFYKMTGERSYRIINIPPGDSVYFVNIPPEHSTIRGIQYYVSFSDGINTITFPANNPVNNPAAIQVNIPHFTYPLNFMQSVYRMISIPLLLNNPQIDSVLLNAYGPYNNIEWRLFRYEPGISNYLEYPNIADQLLPVNAFWLISREGKTFDLSSAVTVQSNNPFTVTLQTGWNQIGVPFAFPVEWDSVQNKSNLQGPHLWDPGTEDYKLSETVLQPWEGYWIFNPLEPVDILIPPVESGPIGKTNVWQNLNSGEFILQIKAKSNLSEINRTSFIGMLNNASEGQDIYDLLEPPPISDKLRISIINKEKYYSQNISAVSDKGAYWDLKISSSLINKNISLQFEEISPLPDKFRIWLLDMNRSISIPLTGNKVFFSLPEEGIGFYKLITGTEEYAKEISGNISLNPGEYILFQNYPNPFNPSTTIMYQLKEKSNVTLEIFDILGRRIVSLINNQLQDPGIYNYIWEGTNSFNNKAASGIYIYRITANDFIQSKSMILLK